MNASTIAREFKEVPLGLIDAPVLPSRQTMDERRMEELVASIRQLGLLQPVILARNGERFHVVAGHRRTLASRKAGLVVVPAIIYPSAAAAVEAMQYAENRHREDLNPADESIWFAELLESKCGGDTNTLADLVGEKRAYVESRLLLLQGDDRVFQALQDGRIKIGVAQQLNLITDERMRRYYLDCAIRGGATVGVVAGWVGAWKRDSALQGDVPAAAEPRATPSAVPELAYFRCYVCGETTDVHLMEPVNVHRHCRMAILDKVMETYRGGQ